MITDKQKEFCINYVKYDNGKKAAEMAGYKGNSTAATLLKKKEIKEYVELLREEIAASQPIRAIEVKTAADVRDRLRETAEMLLNREIDSRTAQTLNGIYNTMLGSIRVDKQQQEIEELKKEIEELMEDM